MYYPVIKTPTTGLTGVWTKVAGFVVASVLNFTIRSSERELVLFDFVRFLFCRYCIYICIAIASLCDCPDCLLVASPGQAQVVLGLFWDISFPYACTESLQ
jgi:hypothetical protein